MKLFVYTLGRAFQLLALLVLPSALWAGSFGHSEAGAIIILLGTVVLFYAGYFLTRSTRRL